MADKQVALSVLQGAIGIAGLLLVFCGFLLSRADSFKTKSGHRLRTITRLGLFPLLGALGCAWMSILALEEESWAAAHLLFAIKTVLAVTAAFATVAVLTSHLFDRKERSRNGPDSDN